MTMAIQNVAIVGANGTLGLPILEALKRGPFQVTAVKRASSSFSPAGVRIATYADDMAHDSLVAAFAGQDAVIVCFRPDDAAQQIKLGEAAAHAGVRRFLPADFGSCDASSPQAQDLVPLFRKKVEAREALQRLAAASDGAFSWTSLVCGHFFDWGLRENFLHFDLAKRTADVLDDGRARSSQSTLAFIAEAVVKVLLDEIATRNRVLFVQSFCVSQLDVLAALQKATGGHEWRVNWIKSDDFIRENKARADAGDKAAIEHLVFALGVLDGDWEKKDGFANGILGLQGEDLDEVVRKVVHEAA